MLKKQATLLLLLSPILLSIPNAVIGKTCGEGIAVATFESDVVNTIKDDQNWLRVSQMYTDWKATTAADFSATEQPDNYKNYFTGKKTCCDPISKLMFKTTFTLHLAKYLQFNTGGLFGNPLAKVMTPLDKLNLQILTAQMKCYQTYAAANPSVATSSPGDSSTDAPENVKKLFEALTAEKMKISSTYRLGYAKIGLAASRLFRGTRIALCMDPDAPLTSIWESGIKVKQADLDSLTKDLAEGLVLIKTATVRSYEMFAFQAKSSQAHPIISCDVQKLVDDFVAAKNTFCPDDDADCTQTAASFLTSAFTIPALESTLTAAAPAPGMRVLATSSIKADAAGVTAYVVDDEEDQTIVLVGGSTVDTLQQDDTKADQMITDNGQVNYTATLEVYTMVPNSTNSTSSATSGVKNPANTAAKATILFISSLIALLLVLV